MKTTLEIAAVSVVSFLLTAGALFLLVSQTTVEIQTVTTKTYRVVPPWQHHSDAVPVSTK